MGLRHETALPAGWMCKAMSASGQGVYVKRVHRTAPDGRPWFTTYRAIFNGWMGGWIVDQDRQEGSYLFNGVPFPSAIAAMVATDIELAALNQ